MVDIIFRLIVNKVRKIELTSVIKFAAGPFAELSDLGKMLLKVDQTE